MLTKRPALLLAVVLLYATVTSVYEAANRPFWYDEVFTVVLSRLPSMADVQRALGNAADTSAPGFYVIERAASAVVPDPEIAFRIASILAIPFASVCLFLFAREHLGPAGALAAALVPFVSALYHGYSVEARPYGVGAALLTMAMLGWQWADRARWCVVLAAGLALAASVNYHAVFMIGPIALAEMVWTASHRRWRLRVWAALAVGTLPLVIFWGNLSQLRRYYGENYWTHGSFADIVAGYDWLYGVSHVPGLGLGIALALAATLALSVWKPGWFPRAHAERVPAATIVLIVAVIALPWIVALTGRLLGGGFTPRYGIGVVSGIALALAYTARLFGPRAIAITSVILLVTLGWREAAFWRGEGHPSPLSEADLAQHERMLAHAAPGSLPIVVSNGLHFVPIAYYRTGAHRARLVALVDPDAALKYSGTDSVDLDLEVLRDYMPIQIVDYRTFIARHDRFLLYSSPGRSDWWPRRLRDEAYTLDVVAREGSRTLYRVSKPKTRAKQLG